MPLGIPFHQNPITNEDTLRRVFEQFGPVKSIHLVKNVFTGNSRRYAFVEMVEERDAKGRCLLWVRRLISRHIITSIVRARAA